MVRGSHNSSSLNFCGPNDCVVEKRRPTKNIRDPSVADDRLGAQNSPANGGLVDITSEQGSDGRAQ